MREEHSTIEFTFFLIDCKKRKRKKRKSGDPFRDASKLRTLRRLQEVRRSFRRRGRVARARDRRRNVPDAADVVSVIVVVAHDDDDDNATAAVVVAVELPPPPS